MLRIGGDAGNDRLALGLLVDRHGRVPAPVDEQRQEHALRERPDVHVGQEPPDRGMDRGDRVRGVDLGQRDHREDHEHQVLEAEQEPLQARRDLDAERGHDAHEDEEDDAGAGHPERRGGQAVGADQQEEVAAGDLSEAGHDDDVGGDHHPAGHPARPRSHGSGDPAERGAAVGVDFVQVVVRLGDQDHRHERDDHDRRGLEPDAQHRRDQPQGHGEAVRGSRGRHTDDDARQQSDGVRLEPLVGLVRRPLGCLLLRRDRLRWGDSCCRTFHDGLLGCAEITPPQTLLSFSRDQLGRSGYSPVCPAPPPTILVQIAKLLRNVTMRARIDRRRPRPRLYLR